MKHQLREIIQDKPEFAEAELAETQPQILLKAPTERVNKEVTDVENLAPGVSLNTTQTRLEALNRIFRKLNRCYYFGTPPIENDPGRLE